MLLVCRARYQTGTCSLNQGQRPGEVGESMLSGWKASTASWDLRSMVGFDHRPGIYRLPDATYSQYTESTG
jgi:hypothetical protein